MSPSETTLIFLALLLPFIGAVLSPILYRIFKSFAPWLLALLPLF